MLFKSTIVIPLSIATAPEFSVKVAVPPALTVGASLTRVIVIAEVAAADAAEESSETIHVIVRLVAGLLTEEENVTERKAA